VVALFGVEGRRVLGRGREERAFSRKWLILKNGLLYESALEKDANIISQVACLEAATDLYQSLWDQRQLSTT